MKPKDVLIIFLIFRLLSVFLVESFYVADEYWQSLEVAHNLAFGYGHLTWEWHKGIRSYVYPLIIAIYYKVLLWLNLDHAMAVIIGPRIMQALLSAYADFCFYRFCGYRKWSIFCNCANWFSIYVGSRTIINTFEANLTTIALSMYPWQHKKAKFRNNNFLWIVAFVCVVRPTATIPWFPLCLSHVFANRRNLGKVLYDYLVAGISVFVPSVVLDSIAHGDFLISSLNFLKYNGLYNISYFYGSQPWFWYLIFGIPAVLFLYTPFFIFGAYNTLKSQRTAENKDDLLLLVSIAFTVFAYSFVPHKEFRFVLSISPMMMRITVLFFSRWTGRYGINGFWLLAMYLVVSNGLLATYISVLHQRGTVSIMAPIREDAAQNKDMSVLFLLPCHSTPYYSHVHANISMRFLTCEPNFNNTPNYKDEAERFYDNPEIWLHTEYPEGSDLPTHVVAFETLLRERAARFFNHYELNFKTFYCDIFDDMRRSRYILLYKRKNSLTVQFPIKH